MTGFRSERAVSSRGPGRPRRVKFPLQRVYGRADARCVDDALGVVGPEGEALPPARLGRLLHAARRSRGLTLRSAARTTGIPRPTLAAYERGVDTAPAEHLALLAGAYRSSVEALLGGRDVVRVEGASISAGGKVRVLASQAGEVVLGGYVELIRELRGARPGDPLPLRTADLEALAVVIGSDVDDVEARIVEILGCTPEQAAVIHRELLSRRVLRPVAGVALGAAALAGLTLPQFDRSPTQPHLVEVEAAPVASTDTVATTTSVPTTSSTTSSTTPSTTAPPATSPPATAAPAPPTTAAPPPTVAAVPAPPTTATPVTTTAPAPPADPDPPVGLLPGEEFTIVQE